MYLLLLCLLSTRASLGAASYARGQQDARSFRDEGDRWTAISPEAGAKSVVTLSGVQFLSGRGRVEVRTESWGRPGALATAAPTGIAPGTCAFGQQVPQDTGIRCLDLRGDGLTESWAGMPHGFEQSWTVEAPPKGEGDLVLDVSVEGAEVALGDGALRLDGKDGETWLVSRFAAWDADGVALAMRLEQIGGGFRVSVDDTRARYPVEVDPVYGTAAVTFTGEAEGDALDHVSGAGDINGDGYDDIVVAAAGHDSETGRVYVYLGSASGASSAAATILDGEDAGDDFGYAVSAAGDINGYGYDDVIIGAYRHDSVTGRAYLYLGSASGLSDVPSATLDGAASGDYFGYAVSGAGDLNGDGYDDVVVGAYESDDSRGRVYVYYGSASRVSASDATILSGALADEQLGWSVSGAGDVNGDGYDDLVVGALGSGGGYDSDYGRAYVFHGSASGVSTSAATALEGAYIWDGFGYSVSGAGDVNGDGYDDIVIGSGFYGGTIGLASVYCGSPTGISTSATVLAGEADSHFGLSVSGLGDVNGDGYDDVLVGALEYGDLQGRAYIYPGSASGLSTTATTTLTGETKDDEFGRRVSGAGDVNGDGYADFLVGAPGYNSDTGRAYLYLSNIDADGDGYFSVDDCNDADASVYPGADEVACDGIDQDCDGTDLTVGCDTGTDTGDTGTDTGETGTDSADSGADTGDTDADTHDSGDSSPTDTDTDTDTCATDTCATDTDGADTAPADSGGADDTAPTPKPPPGCGCSTPTPAPGVALLALVPLLVLRRRRPAR